MGANLSKLRLTDGPGFPRLWNRLIEELQRCVITSVAPPLMLGGDVAGQRLSIARQNSTSDQYVPASFQIYRSSTDDPDTDWRTIRVRSGFINYVHPVGSTERGYSDDNDPDPDHSAIILEPATTCAIFLRQTYTLGGSAWNITKTYIDVAAIDPQTGAVDGWPGFNCVSGPKEQPVRNVLLKLIGIVAVGSDDPESDDYHRLDIQQILKTDVVQQPANLTRGEIYACADDPENIQTSDWRRLCIAGLETVANPIVIDASTTETFWLRRYTDDPNWIDWDEQLEHGATQNGGWGDGFAENRTPCLRNVWLKRIGTVIAGPETPSDPSSYSLTITRECEEEDLGFTRPSPIAAWQPYSWKDTPTGQIADTDWLNIKIRQGIFKESLLSYTGSYTFTSSSTAWLYANAPINEDTGAPSGTPTLEISDTYPEQPEVAEGKAFPSAVKRVLAEIIVGASSEVGVTHGYLAPQGAGYDFVAVRADVTDTDIILVYNLFATP